MDLNDLKLEEKSEAGAFLHLRHPITNKPLDHKGEPMGILLTGRDSAAYRETSRRLQNARIAKAVGDDSKDYVGTDDAACELLAACTIGFDNLQMGGKDLILEDSAAFELYSNFGWIREQVDLFVGSRANFF